MEGTLRNERTTEEIAHAIRARVFEHTIRNNGGYLSQAASAAEQLAFLYNEALNLGPSTMPMIPPPFSGVPSAENTEYRTGAGYNGPFDVVHDRLFIAPAHYALVAYACLIEVGRMAPEGLEMFNKDGSSVEMIGAEHSPGMEVHNGTLGIGLSTGAGLAWGRKKKGEEGEVCVFMSDGEVQEGQTWEAVQAAAFHQIDNLWAIMDVNRQQCDGAMDSVMEVGDIATKLRNFGAVVAEVDAHDVAALRQAKATPHEGQPLIILAHSSPTHGMEFLRRRFPRLHYVRFRTAEERAEMNTAIAAELGIAPVDLGEN
ncbi:MAG: transketolase [Rubellimicrobium sp.]|nr:transketolase [Rubellimicrobium sp.]